MDERKLFRNQMIVQTILLATAITLALLDWFGVL